MCFPIVYYGILKAGAVVVPRRSFRTGGLARKDEDGYYYIVDRSTVPVAVASVGVDEQKRNQASTDRSTRYSNPTPCGR